MKINNNIFKTKKIKISVLLFLCCILFTSFSAQDSLKTNYALNDPRNPDCPCHKYQKLADEEFKKLLAIANKKVSNGNLNAQFLNSNIENRNSNATNFSKLKSLNYSSKAVSKKHFFLFHHRHKNKIKLHPKLRRALDIKHWQILKRARKLNSCFHWT